MRFSGDAPEASLTTGGLRGTILMTRRAPHSLPDAPSNRTGLSTVRTGLSVDEMIEAIVDNLRCLQGKLPQHATRHDWYVALAYAVRDRLLDRALTTAETTS